MSAHGDFSIARGSRVLVATSRCTKLFLWVRSRGTQRFEGTVLDGEDAIAPAGAGQDACASDA